MVKWSLVADAGLELGNLSVRPNCWRDHQDDVLTLRTFYFHQSPGETGWRLHTSNKTTRVGVWKCKGERNSGPDVNINV